MSRVLNIIYYKDLSPEDELKLVLWLEYFESFVVNALKQKRRWKRTKDTWDLQMFFVAVKCIKEATDGLMNLKFFCSNEEKIWGAMVKFRKYFDETNLKNFRDESIHRDELYNQKRTLSIGKVIILGGLKNNSGKYVYQFGINEISILEAFKSIETLVEEIRVILDNRIKNHPDPMTYNKGMIPWTLLRSFLKKQKKYRL